MPYMSYVAVDYSHKIQLYSVIAIKRNKTVSLRKLKAKSYIDFIQQVLSHYTE